jgi:hypothetical protein
LTHCRLKASLAEVLASRSAAVPHFDANTPASLALKLLDKILMGQQASKAAHPHMQPPGTPRACVWQAAGLPTSLLATC